MFVNLLDNTQLCKVVNQLVPARKPVHPFIQPGPLVHRTVWIHHVDLLKVVSASYLKVVGIVSRCDFHSTGTERRIHEVVCDDNQFPVQNRSYNFV